MYFDYFGTEYIPQEILKTKSKINQSVTTCLKYSMMIALCVVLFYCFQFLIAGKTLLDYANLFSSNDYQKNDKIIYKYFKDKYSKEYVSLDFRLKK